MILRGDAIEMMVHGIVAFPFSAVIMGHSVYCLFRLSVKRESATPV